MTFFNFIKSLFIFIREYILYFLTARHFKGYGLHSPFIFQLYRKVISKKDDEKLTGLKKYLRYLKKVKTLVSCDEDPGAGSVYGGKETEKLNRLIKQSSVPHKYGRILYNLVKFYQPMNILELGTSVGISTLYLASANEKARIWTIEGCKNKQLIARENIQILGLQNVYFYNNRFDEVLPRVLYQMPSVDMVFMDGDHRRANTVNYFELILDYVHNNTIVVIDDIHWSGDMEEAWKEIWIENHVRVTVDLFRRGIVFFKKELSAESFKIRY
jgi:predicted O-methyltransferase YrrM